MMKEEHHAITENAEVIDRFEHLNRVLKAIRNVSQSIVAENDPRRLIERACLNLTGTMGYRNAWIALLGGEAARGLGLPETAPVAAVAKAGFDGGFEILLERLERGEFPECMKRGLECGEVLEVSDPAADCPDCPLHGQYRGRAGLARSLNFDGVTYGILAASVPAAYARDAEEQDLFNEVAGDLAFALHKIPGARKLEESRRYLDFVIKGSGIGTWEWNVRTNETRFNEQWAAMLGYTIEELTPCDYTTRESLVHPEDIGQARLALADCVEGGAADYNCEFRMRHKAGRWVWILDQGRIMTRDEAGKALSMFGTHTDITKIMQTEEALKKSELELKRSQRQSKTGSWEYNIITGDNRWSDEMFYLYGYEPHEIEPTYEFNVNEILHDDNKDIFDKALEDILEGRDTPPLEYKALKKNGSAAWFHSVMEIERNPDGEPVRIFGTAQDITARKRAEDALAESEARYQDLYENAPDMFVSVDAKTGFVNQCNRTLSTKTGFAREDVVGKPVFERYAPESLDGAQAAFRQFVETGEVKDAELQLRRKDGGIIDVSLNVAAVRDETGSIVQSQSSWRDITERKAAEEALRESERRLLLATKSAGVGIWVWDIVTDKMTWDERIFQMYGITDIPKQYGLEFWQNCLHPDDREFTAEACQAAVRGEKDYDVKFRVRWPDGTIRWMKGDGAVIRDDGGKPIRMLGTNYDITDLKESEQRFKALHNASFGGIIIHDKGLILECNQGLSDITGYSYDELIGMDGFGLIPEKSRPEVTKNISTGYEKPYEIYGVRKNGEEYPLRLEARDIPYEGKMVRVVEFRDITQRKRAELALKEVLLRKREAIKAGNVGLWDWDLKTNTVQYSAEWKRQIGYEEDEIGDGFDEWESRVHPDDLPHTLAQIRQYVRDRTGTGGYQVEFRFRHKDGSYRWILAHATVLTDENGEPVRTLGSHLDITERKAAEEERRQLFQLIDAADNIAVFKDPELRYLSVNQAYLRLTGYRRLGELVGKTDADLFKGMATDEQIREYMDNDRKAMLLPAGEHYTVEERLDGDDGRERFFLTKKFPIHSKDSGELLGVSTLSTEITAQKEAEKALRKSESLFQTMLAAIPDMISIHDTEMNVVYSNWKGSADVPMDRRVLGEKCFRIYRGHDKVCPDCRAKQVFETRKPHMEEVDLPEGRWIELNVVPILDADGDCELFIEWARDITEHKKTDERLRQMAKMESVGRLAGGVAHDFNNMLSVILGHAEMVLEQMAPDQPFYDDLMEIMKAAERSANLTRQLLAFARKQTVAPKVIDFDRTVEGMLKMLQRLIGEDIDMAWIPHGNVWRVKIDPGQIDQILANLCVNARDAIDGVGKVIIETDNIVFDEEHCKDHAEFTPGDYVMLAVSDDGCGMDEETRAEIFHPFFTTKGVGEGTGLGLATVYGVVKQNNGFINVYSEPGQGTTFKIYLPRHTAKTTPLPEKGPDRPGKRGRETVLLVEDEPSILRMTTRVLERQGYKVAGASTPGEAVRLAAEHVGEIHLLMTDVVMPEMNGRDLAKNILSLYPGMKCLFMSGYTANVIAHHGVLDEGVNFIQKPFSIGALAVKVREALD